MDDLTRNDLLRAMCHLNECACADRGEKHGKYSICRIASQHTTDVLELIEKRKSIKTAQREP